MGFKRSLLSLVAGIFLGACFVSGCNNFPYDKSMIKKQEIYFPKDYINKGISLSSANQRLIEFPCKINGIDRVEKYFIPDAKKCLVQLKQAHWIEGLSKEELGYVKVVQDNVYESILDIHRSHNIRKIYHEGLTKATAPIFELCADISYFLKNPEEIEKVESRRIPKILIDLEYLKKEQKDLFESYIWLEGRKKYDASYKLLTEGKDIEICFSEDIKTLADYKKFYDFYHKNLLNKVICELTGAVNAHDNSREDSFLQIAAEEPEELLVFVYGLGHDFKDNIKKWNLEHPDKRFSFIEAYPKRLLLR